MPIRLGSIFGRKDKIREDVPAGGLLARANTVTSTLSLRSATPSRAAQLSVVDEAPRQTAKPTRNRLKTLSKLNPLQKPPPKSVEITSEDLYACKDLMRTKYTLDVEVHAMRKVRRVNLHIREEKQRRATGAMEEILRRVGEWDKDASFNPEELELVMEIQKRLGLRPDPPLAGDSSSGFERVSYSS